MNSLSRPCLSIAVTLVLLIAAAASWSLAAQPATGPSTQPTAVTVPASRPAIGPNVVVLNELVALYEPVPFAHRRHAQMAEMWDGCTTCHHHTPQATTAPTSQPVMAMAPHAPSKDDTTSIPACKSCHPSTPDTPGIHMPSLKAAYHRQCLNCHRDWMDSNACVACHAVRKVGAAATIPAPVPDDITGRMHKPIAAPATRPYVARFTPVAGANVLFRHDEHAKGFGITCATCHHRDSCADCHAAPDSAAAAAETTTRPHPVQPGRTWRDTHGPCVTCHEADRCNHCHYPDGQSPPPPFDHRKTGQTLDVDHAKLACAQCHPQLKAMPATTCGGVACHKRVVAWPADRPGLYTPATTQPATAPATAPATQPAATAPSTRPVIIRLRRGGS